MRTITLDAQHAKQFTDGKFPELEPARIFGQHRGPLVLPIKGRRFMVVIESEEDDGIPEAGTVTFIETTNPETPFTLWDGMAVTRDGLERAQRGLAQLQKHGPEKGFEEYYEPDLDRARREIKRHEEAIADGEPAYRPSKDHAFGQPTFLQDNRVPLHEGKPVYHLLTFETGWGDAGNENYMVALDADGWPVAIYFEASCC